MVGRVQRVRTALVAVFALLLVGAASAKAQDFTVINTNDSGPGSLRQAITDANASPDPTNTITISATGQIQLASALPILTTPMQISGPGSASLDVHRQTGGNYRVLETFPGDAVSISGLTVSNGSAAGNGGGIYNHASQMTLTDVVVRDSVATLGGGGIYNTQTLTLINSKVTGNTASGSGGGINNAETLTIKGSTVSGNTADHGGGLYSNAYATVDSSTFSGNHAVGAGGGGLQSDGTGFTSNPPQLTIVNSTIAHNTAAGFGGGIDSFDTDVNPPARPTTTVASSTIVGNQAGAAGGGLQQFRAIYAVRNSLIAQNTATGGSPDCANGGADVYGSQGYNLIGSTSGCAGFTGTGDQVNVANAMIGPLGANGGPTETIALLPGSPAIHAGNPATPGSGGRACLATDQRGLPRGGAAGRCDIGAFQTQPPAGPGGKTTLSGLGISPHKASIAGRKVKGKCVNPTAKNKGEPHCRRAINLNVTFTLNTAGTVTLTISRQGPGRKVKGKCVKQTKKNAGKKKCTRTTNVPGSIAISGKTGANTYAFNGNIGGKKLTPGKYTLKAATAAGSASVKFQLVG